MPEPEDDPIIPSDLILRAARDWGTAHGRLMATDLEVREAVLEGRPVDWLDFPDMMWEGIGLTEEVRIEAENAAGCVAQAEGGLRGSAAADCPRRSSGRWSARMRSSTGALTTTCAPASSRRGEAARAGDDRGDWDGSRGTCPAAAASRVHGNPLRIFVIPVTQNVGVRLIRNKHTVSVAHFNRIQVGERMGALARIPTGPLNHG